MKCDNLPWDEDQGKDGKDSASQGRAEARLVWWTSGRFSEALDESSVMSLSACWVTWAPSGGALCAHSLLQPASQGACSR